MEARCLVYWTEVWKVEFKPENGGKVKIIILTDEKCVVQYHQCKDKVV